MPTPQVIGFVGDTTKITLTVVPDPSAPAPRAITVELPYADFRELAAAVAAARAQAESDLHTVMPALVNEDLVAAADGVALVTQVSDPDLADELRAVFARITRTPPIAGTVSASRARAGAMS